MADVPWWLHDDGIYRPRIPYSGEAFPIDVPPIPVSVPVVGPPIHYIGQLEHAVWDDVWGWIKGTSKVAVDAMVGIETTIVTGVVNVVENYVGNELKAFSGFINDAFGYAYDGTEALALGTAGVFINLQAAIDGFGVEFENVWREIVGIEGHIIPGIEAEIARLGIDTFDLVGAAVQNVETWAIDTIYDPLLREILRVNDLIRADVFDALAQVLHDAEAYTDAHLAEIVAAIAALATEVATITTFVDECGQPMCDVMGPKTDLGKLLKSLKFAAELAALAALANMTGAELEQFVTSVAAHLAGVVGDVEQYLQPGGETLAGLFARVTAEAL